MDHVMFIQKVCPEKKEEYIQAHRHVWPELLKAHRNAGIEREIIWIQGDTLYLYIMAQDFDKALDNMGKETIFQRWIEKMTPLLSDIQDYSEDGKIVKLDKVFDLEEQLMKINE